MLVLSGAALGFRLVAMTLAGPFSRGLAEGGCDDGTGFR